MTVAVPSSSFPVAVSFLSLEEDERCFFSDVDLLLLGIVTVVSWLRRYNRKKNEVSRAEQLANGRLTNGKDTNPKSENNRKEHGLL